MTNNKECCASAPRCIVNQMVPSFKCQAVMPDGSFAEATEKHIIGKPTIILFYPFDFTFVCPSEIVAFDKAMPEFEARGVQVVAVSIDSHFSHYAWRNMGVDKGGIGPVKFPILSDLDKSIARNFGCLFEEGGFALRGLYLTDAKGIIRHQLVNDPSIGRSVEEAIRVVDALQFHEKHGEVCPANWKKGDKGMKATAAGVAEYMKTQA